MQSTTCRLVEPEASIRLDACTSEYYSIIIPMIGVLLTTNYQVYKYHLFRLVMKANIPSNYKNK